MATHEVTFPITDPAEILKLRAGDEVTVQGHIIGIRDRTQIRIFDQGVEPPMDLKGAFLLHTAPGVRKLENGKYEPVCIGTTTSARMVRFTEPLGAQYGVRAICGKGGFPDEAIEPMQRLGMVYLAIVGGAAALDGVGIVNVPTFADEHIEPALTAVGRALISGAGETAAMPHQQRIFSLAVLRQEVLHVHLLDLVLAVRVDFRGHAAWREHDLLDWLAGDLDDTASDMERTHVTQADGLLALGIRRSRRQAECRHDH